MASIRATLSLVSSNLAASVPQSVGVSFHLRTAAGDSVDQVILPLPSPAPSEIGYVFTNVDAGDYTVEAATVDSNSQAVGPIKNTAVTVEAEVPHLVAGSLALS